MKSKFLIVAFFLSLMACSTDDNNDNQTGFEPITLDLTGLGIEVDDTDFSVENYNFNTYRAVSSDPGGDDMNDSNDPIFLAYPDGNSNPSTLELDLGSANGLSKITISLSNNCGGGCTAIQTLNSNGEILQAFNDDTTVPTGSSEVLIENIDNSMNTLKISSFETAVYSIRLE